MSKFSGLRLCGVASATGVLALSACLLAAPEPGWAQSADQSRGTTRGAQSSNDGQNRRVRVHNQTGWTIVSLYAADPARTDWRGDLLTPEVLATGDSAVIDVDNGSGACVYVVRAEFSNGERLERVGVNVCRIADYYFTR
ncbi:MULTISPECIES: hypothetical protein [unclassified Brevundimonas]|uniref:hypothetical protein n=1 Tax=unclassified Brevundimonas TaxID=2622653 RepID=UPI000C48CC14|nr:MULTISPECIES: hypothetical protein [unclassified Brevundimonas]MAL88266.1 hypothetical protein [Brevundimonas sp.]